MNIQIQVLSTQVETKPTTKGSYQQIEVAYKDLTQGGKVLAKKLMSFTNKEVFEAASLMKPTEVYDIEMTKGEKYWDWVKVTKGSQTATTVGTASSKATAYSATQGNSRGFETPEERAKKQIYIVRQSSVSAAINLLTVHVKTQPSPEEVIKVARQFEAYVFESGDAQAVAGKDVQKLDGFEDILDVPF